VDVQVALQQWLADGWLLLGQRHQRRSVQAGKVSADVPVTEFLVLLGQQFVVWAQE